MADAVREAENVVAGEVSVRNSAVRTISGGDIDIEQSAIMRIQAGTVEVEQSSVTFVSGEKVEIEGGTVIAAAARNLHLKKVTTVFLFAPRASGDVRTVFDWKGGLAFAAGILLMRRLLKLLRID